MFELNDGVMRQLLFAVENKKVSLLVDVSTGEPSREEDVPHDVRPPDRETLDPSATFVYPPDWTSADGFALMSRFAVHESDPAAATALQRALDAGRGVFRAFKDALREHPEAERRWKAFKTRELQGVVLEWYNALRDVRGLPAVERGVDEDFDDLVEESFTFETVRGFPADSVLELDSAAVREALAGVPDQIVEEFLSRRAANLTPEDGSEHVVISATTPGERRVGFLWYHVSSAADTPRLATAEMVYVDPSFRGLGIATHLVEEFFRINPEAMTRRVIRSPGGVDWFRRCFPAVDAGVLSTSIVVRDGYRFEG